MPTPNAQLTQSRQQVTIRRGGPADYSAIRAVVFEAYRQYVDVVPRRIWPNYLTDLLSVKRHARNGQLVVAEVDGRICASAAFYPDTSVQGLGWPAGWAGGRGLAVHPSARGHGLAQALIAECERLAREVGAPVFAFHSAAFMAGAVALYERLGYQRAPEFDLELNSYYGISEGPAMTIIAYRRDLEQPREQPWGTR